MNLQARPEPTAADAPRTPLNVVDHALCMALSNPSFYREGWGDRGVIDEVLAVAADPPAPELPSVRWIDLPRTSRGLTHMSGYFESPARDLPLPAEARAAYFEMWLPAGSSPSVRPPVCVYLAATAEQGYALRRQFTAPLVRRGVGALFLENPYYGRRQPSSQRLAALSTVADQIIMNTATVLEARALLRWLREDGFVHAGASGFSMGGFMASYVAALTEYPIALIPCLAGGSASMAFTSFPFAHFPAWSRLGEPRQARAELAEIFDVFSIERFPVPAAPELVQLVAARSDAVIVPENVARLARHWGVPIRWVPGGHFSSVVRGRREIHAAILDAFGMLLAR